MAALVCHQTAAQLQQPETLERGMYSTALAASRLGAAEGAAKVCQAEGHACPILHPPAEKQRVL